MLLTHSLVRVVIPARSHGVQHFLTGQRPSRGDRHLCRLQWTVFPDEVLTFVLQGVAGGSGNGVSHASSVNQPPVASVGDGVHGQFGDVGLEHMHLESFVGAECWLCTWSWLLPRAAQIFIRICQSESKASFHICETKRQRTGLGGRGGGGYCPFLEHITCSQYIFTNYCFDLEGRRWISWNYY